MFVSHLGTSVPRSEQTERSALLFHAPPHSLFLELASLLLILYASGEAVSEIGGKRERRIFCVHFPHSLFLCDLEPPLDPTSTQGGSHGGRTFRSRSSPFLLSTHSLLYLKKSLISFSKKCHTLGQLFPLCPVLSLRALCSSGLEGCALRGVLGKASSNPPEADCM